DISLLCSRRTPIFGSTLGDASSKFTRRIMPVRCFLRTRDTVRTGRAARSGDGLREPGLDIRRSSLAASDDRQRNTRQLGPARGSLKPTYFGAQSAPPRGGQSIGFSLDYS